MKDDYVSGLGKFSIDSAVDWKKLKGVVEKGLDTLNDELLEVGADARFEYEVDQQEISIFLSRSGVAEVMPEITILPDEFDKKKVGFMAKHAAGPRPAGMTIPDLKPHQVTDRLSNHLLISLTYDEQKAVQNLRNQKDARFSPEINVLG